MYYQYLCFNLFVARQSDVHIIKATDPNIDYDTIVRKLRQKSWKSNSPFLFDFLSTQSNIDNHGCSLLFQSLLINSEPDEGYKKRIL